MTQTEIYKMDFFFNAIFLSLRGKKAYKRDIIIKYKCTFRDKFVDFKGIHIK